MRDLALDWMGIIDWRLKESYILTGFLQAALDKITGVAIHINKVKRVQELESHEILGWTVSSWIIGICNLNFCYL